MKGWHKNSAPDRSTTVIIWLLSLLLGLLLLATLLLHTLIQNDPKKVTIEALNATFFSNQQSGLNVSGDLYAESLEDGLIQGFQFEGGLGFDGSMNLSLKSRLLVADSTAVLVRTSGSTPLYGKVSGIADITQMYIVGGSAQDLQTYKTLVNHKEKIDGTWYDLSDSKFVATLDSLKLPTLLPGATSQADRQLLADTYEEYPFLVLENTYRGEILLQSATVQYDISLDKNQLEAFVASVQKSNPQLLSTTAASELIQTAQYITSLQLWINQKSHSVEQIRVVYTTDSMRYSLRMRIFGTSPKPSTETPSDTQPVSKFIELLGW